MPHQTGSHSDSDLRHQDLLAVAARQREAATVVAPARLRRTLALLMAVVISGALSQATAPVSSFAASHVNVFSADIPMATEDILTTRTHEYRPAGSVRTRGAADGSRRCSLEDRCEQWIGDADRRVRSVTRRDKRWHRADRASVRSRYGP